MIVTVNQLLELKTRVEHRLSELRNRLSSVTVIRKETYGTGENQRVTENEPQFNAKVLDVKITELENWLYKASSALKQSNATTSLTVDGDSDVLLAHVS